MQVSHPIGTGVIRAGHHKVFSVYVTPAAADASITVVNSADGSGTPAKIASAIAKANTNTVQLTFPGGIDATLGVYVSALAGVGATFGVQYDG